MGLAAPKKKVKLSRDPNNTKWTNNTESFGLKIMTSQGWKQGEYLGAKDSSHAEFHTSANACPIRVSIKDDNLGLGAKVGSGVGHGECTGLDAFKNLLSRLNGKGQDEIDKEQKARDDIRRTTYTEKRWGSIRFVSAGFLIGDQIETLINAEANRKEGLKNKEMTTSEATNDDQSEVDLADQGNLTQEKPTKSKKRKLRANEISKVEEFNEKKQKKKKRKRDTDHSEGESIYETKKVKRAYKVKSDEKSSSLKLGDQKKKSKKKEQPNITEKGKEHKKVKDRCVKSEDSEVSTKKKKKKERSEDDNGTNLSFLGASETSLEDKNNCLPTGSISEVEYPKTLLQGRHAVRARNIAQKRLASMDVTALNQIFMIKT